MSVRQKNSKLDIGLNTSLLMTILSIYVYVHVYTNYNKKEKDKKKSFRSSPKI